VKFHNEYSKKGKFQVVLISADRSEKDMFSHMTESKMPWVSVPYDRIDATGLWQKHNPGGGIPGVVLLDKNGKVVSEGRGKVLADLKEKLGIKG